MLRIFFSIGRFTGESRVSRLKKKVLTESEFCRCVVGGLTRDHYFVKSSPEREREDETPKAICRRAGAQGCISQNVGGA